MLYHHMLGSFDSVYCTLRISDGKDGKVNCKISCQWIKWSKK